MVEGEHIGIGLLSATAPGLDLSANAGASAGTRFTAVKLPLLLHRLPGNLSSASAALDDLLSLLHHVLSFAWFSIRAATFKMFWSISGHHLLGAR